MKKLIYFFNVLGISVFCATSAFAMEIASRIIVEGVTSLAIFGIACRVAWESLKKIIEQYG
ncbi:MAG: hypothetical protein LBI80_04365 [Endomicrobium sp.]|jgi:hypothetical protein|nr:hypothetical protein [Endomicrobium sp.]